MKKYVGYILIAICMIIGVWVVISYIDVIAHNMGDCRYLPWNFFSVMLRWRGIE